MKRSINKTALLAVLAIFFASCAEDPDSTPNFPLDPPSELAFLQGEWGLVSTTNSLKGLHTLQIVDDMTIHKQADGIIVRASYFNVIKNGQSYKIVYGKNLIIPEEGINAPDFFKDPEIISLNKDQLVLQGKGTYTFKKLDPVN